MPRINPTMLDANVAQVANNCVLWHRDLRPLKSPVDVVTPAPRQGTIKSIYRIGQSLPETQYWLAWTTDVDVVRGIVADDADERTYYTGDGPPKMTSLPLATQGGTVYPVTSYRLGIPRPLDQILANIVDTSISGSTADDAETRVYVYTYVNAFGEEGAVSPAHTIRADVTDWIDLSNMSAAPTGNYNIVSKRIYRSVTTGANQGAFFFEAEIPVGTATYRSKASTDDLNEPVTTADYDPPPDDLAGLIALPNGLFAGFSGYDLYFCEPNHPYAWPAKYRQTMDYPIVALGTFGASLVVGTKGSPYIISGTHPDSMTAEKIELDQACVSKRSMVSMGGGVIYASPNGLIYVGAGASKIVTVDNFTREEWQAINPAGIDARWIDGKYIALNGANSFIMNSLEDREFTMFDDAATALYVDKTSDNLYLCIANSIKKFNAGVDKTLTWRSKKQLANMRPAPKCAKVEADAYPITFKLFADGALKHTQTVTSNAVFRLPCGYRPRHLEMELTGSQRVTYAGIADTPEEFRNG